MFRLKECYILPLARFCYISAAQLALARKHYKGLVPATSPLVESL